MSMRRENRVAAIQFLYMWAANTPGNLHDEIRSFFERQERPRDFFSFAEELVLGVIDHVEEIDGTIRKYARNWDFNRIARIDLAILRLAVFELRFRSDIPPIVSINEAIDLAKAFSIPDAKRFINGILDQYKQEIDRPMREPSAGGLS